MSRQRVDSGRLVTALLSRRISYGYSATAPPPSSPQPSLLWPRTASPIRCPTVRSLQTPAGSRPSFTIPRLPDIAECIAFLSASYRRADIRENLISAARGQRIHPVRAVNRPRPSAVLAEVFLPSIGVTRYSALPNFLPWGCVPALTGRRSIKRTSLPSAVSSDRPRPDA